MLQETLEATAVAAAAVGPLLRRCCVATCVSPTSTLSE